MRAGLTWLVAVVVVLAVVVEQSDARAAPPPPNKQHDTPLNESSTLGAVVDPAYIKPSWTDTNTEESIQERVVVSEEQRRTGSGRRIARVVETFYVDDPAEATIPTTSSTPPLDVDPPPLLPPAPPPSHHSPTADIRDTIRTLRPVFVYAVHHPLRAIWFIVKLVATYAYLAVMGLLAFVWNHLSVLSPLLYPYHLVAGLVLAPFIWAANTTLAFLPFWATVVAAIAVGAGVGAIAGMATTQKPRPRAAVAYPRRQEQQRGAFSGRGERLGSFGGPRAGMGGGAEFGSGRGARMEKVDIKGKGKAKMIDSSPDASVSGSGGEWEDVDPAEHEVWEGLEPEGQEEFDEGEETDATVLAERQPMKSNSWRGGSVF
ncbi:hypothetical protein MNV49_007826 [Pseudohyphozyma bogoriensis]|nr:hypothetical protein MNV49_007826 [Pseudohyphozyma bogoriensis]